MQRQQMAANELVSLGRPGQKFIHICLGPGRRRRRHLGRLREHVPASRRRGSSERARAPLASHHKGQSNWAFCRFDKLARGARRALVSEFAASFRPARPPRRDARRAARARWPALRARWPAGRPEGANQSERRESERRETIYQAASSSSALRLIARTSGRLKYGARPAC